MQYSPAVTIEAPKVPSDVEGGNRDRGHRLSSQDPRKTRRRNVPKSPTSPVSLGRVECDFEDPAGAKRKREA